MDNKLKMKYDLSIIIPARNEEFLNRTIEDILEHKRGNTQIIVGLDGQWPYQPIKNNPDVVILFFPEAIGQRAISNRCVQISNAKYIMKVDAHCAFDEGFDVKMMGEMRDDWTMVPIMRNLHVFDWVCPNGHRRYQSPSGPCQVCGQPTQKDVVWIAKTNPASTSYCFDTEPHFQYFREFKKHPEYKKALEESGLTETMSLQGSCFMCTRDKYWELKLCDEKLGNWGNQGIEVALKTWLSGGRVLCNHKTWYAHMFRTQGGDFGFPWPNSGRETQRTKNNVKNLLWSNKWSKQVRPVSWLLEKFWPVKGWTEEDRAKIKAWPLQKHGT